MRNGLLLLILAIGLTACGASGAAPASTPTAAAAHSLPTPPPPTAGPTRTPAPDTNIQLENHLGTGWQRAEIAWSPDSQNFAVTYWVNWRAQTFLVNARTGDTLDLADQTGLDMGRVAWSPDGKKLAAVAGDDMDLGRLSVWLLAGGTPVRLMDGACEDLTWSPDSAVLLATCELYDWRGPAPPLDQTPGATQTVPQQGGVWGGGQVWRMQAQPAGGPPQRLLDLEQKPLIAFGAGTRFDTARHPVWSGEHIAFEVRSADKAVALKMGIAVTDAKGQSPRLVTTRPVWLVGGLPDGRLLVRSNVFAGQIIQYTDDLYALNIDMGTFENLSHIDTRCDPLENPRCQGAKRQLLTAPDYAALSPDGRKYYYRATGRSDVIGSRGSLDWLVIGAYPPRDLALEYSAAREDPTGARLLHPMWLRDGRLAYVETFGFDPQTRTVLNSNVVVQFKLDSQTVRREEVGTWEVFAAGFAPDGSRAAVATDFGVIVYGLP